MTALLTDNLPLLAGAPNGIKKLRELILELAVRGKLVPQDPNDEPAIELLKRIAEEKARLVAEGKIKKQKPLPEVCDASKHFDLPANWAWARLGSQVLESGAGWSPSCESSPRSGSEWGVLKVSAVSWGVFRPEENKALPANLDARPEHEVREGDFLVSRANTAELVARSVVVEAAPSNLMLSDKIVRLKLTFLCERRYVNLVNSAPLARAYYSQVAGGTSSSMKNVSREQILNLPLALPPLAEQHRIVAKVDKLMALCDRLEAQQADAESAHAQLVQALLGSLTQAADAEDFATSWQRLAEHFHTLFTTESSIDALKQILLQLAVMGKLVPQEPSDEPASELLKRVAEEKLRLVTEGEVRKPKALLGISDEEIPFNLPQGWQWVRKADVFNFLNGYAFKSEWFQQRGIRLLRNINVAHGVVDWKEAVCIQEEQAADYQAFSLVENDVVLTLDRPIISTGLKYAVIRRDDLPCLLLQRVAKISPYAASVTVGYLTIWLNSSFFVGAIDPGRSNGVPHISTNQVAGMLFALPPLEEQHRIVAKVDELMALCDQLKARLNQACQVHEQLATALVEQAVA
ncbi:restriction endonuclease subunit S [uncultured Pseudomonas sp.]|uniref:restriction endonuclease subunit S n=1 Tax=uncultured Pseudomonas sp. TaxID=114707 RepID=UPI0025E4AFCD|nr:restriction endonuclease subunit S [uncultured Pseudomonas sp.]